MLRALGRLFGSGSGRAPENEVWDKLVSESEPGIREAGDVISGLIDRAGGLSAATPEARFRVWEADRLVEEIISGAERELKELCDRYDYRQLLFLSRLCTGVPLLRDADADMAAVRVRVQNADRWVLRCGNRSLTRDFVRIEDGGISIGAVPESIFRDAVKLHWLANFHQWRVIDRAMFNFVRLVSHENGLPEPRLILLAGGASAASGARGRTGPTLPIFCMPHGALSPYSPECVPVTLRRGSAFAIVPVWIYSLLH